MNDTTSRPRVSETAREKRAGSPVKKDTTERRYPAPTLNPDI
jgi:hypothetical protein